MVMHAQSCTSGGGVTCTPNYSLWKLPAGYTNWDTYINLNFSLIDTAIATKASVSGTTFTGPINGSSATFSGTVSGTFSGSGAALTVTASSLNIG